MLRAAFDASYPGVRDLAQDCGEVVLIDAPLVHDNWSAKET